jgi:hypothetical protein
MEHIAWRRSVALSATALLAFVAGASALAADQDFTLHNHTQRIMKSLNVSPAGTDRWSEDILGQDILDGHTDLEVKFARSRSECEWDVRAEFRDGSTAQVRDVNLCADDKVTFGPSL